MTAAGPELEGLSLDLDDTLWPVGDVIRGAEAELRGWLERHAPATARRFGAAELRAVRDEVVRARPEWLHDLSRLREASLEAALARAGDDPALARPAFEVFYAARNRVVCYADALPALEALARRWPLVALTNGNADLERIGIARYFVATVSAREVGASKPDARMFHRACQRLDAEPRRVLHVGDDWAMDIVGAERAGLHSAWVRRDDGPLEALDPSARPLCVVPDLGRLVERLTG